ncbi:hypothetical protein CKAH01_18677 [Colletotrichum kahawae]|uniref:Uncharacterized protein n=1 Tax=Colletotrichum kahawae TaxID=34407 RepID=A0AAE0D202_COLKA|nr:hypothetical protein CKAH01_18677 [Colletotrichum kahawae]
MANPPSTPSTTQETVTPNPPPLSGISLSAAVFCARACTNDNCGSYGSCGKRAFDAFASRAIHVSLIAFSHNY